MSCRPAAVLCSPIALLELPSGAKRSVQDSIEGPEGHLLLGIGVLIGVEGPVNTYLRAGEPFFPTYIVAHSSVMIKTFLV